MTTEPYLDIQLGRRHKERVRKLWHFRTWLLQEKDRFKYLSDQYEHEWMDMLCARYASGLLDPVNVYDFDRWYVVKGFGREI
jgi:hypothetical protein